LSLTIGVAFATLLVVSAILAGPAILDCGHQTGGVGACLRDRVEKSGLLPSAAPVSERPVSIASVSSVAPPMVADAPRAPGWIEANATEYQPPLSGTAALSPPAGALGATGAISQQSGFPGRASNSSRRGAMAAAGEAAQVTFAEDGQVVLAEPDGEVTATGTVVARHGRPVLHLQPEPGVGVVAGEVIPGVTASADAAIAAPLGHLAASGTGTFATDAVAAVLAAQPASIPLGSGSIGAHTIDAQVTLEAELPPAATELPTAATPPPPVPRRLAPAAMRPPAQPKAAAIADRKTGTPRALRYDPRYPNVLVLPPPNSGADSSFATLQLR